MENRFPRWMQGVLAIIWAVYAYSDTSFVSSFFVSERFWVGGWFTEVYTLGEEIRIIISMLPLLYVSIRLLISILYKTKIIELLKTNSKTTVGVVFIIVVGLFINETPKSSTNSSSSSNSSVTLDEYQLFDLVKGCCRGSGGIWSQQKQSCITREYTIRNAFTSCVGKGKVRYKNGNTHSYNGNQFAE